MHRCLSLLVGLIRLMATFDAPDRKYLGMSHLNGLSDSNQFLQTEDWAILSPILLQTTTLLTVVYISVTVT